jgi:hypothetical protein
MGRIFLIGALLYGYGGAGFDGHRPAELDRPLRNLHRTVDTAASQAQRVLVAIDNKARMLPAVLPTHLPTLAAKLRRLSDAL